MSTGMLTAQRNQSKLTYLLAAALTVAPAFHTGDTIQIETWLNARSDSKFLSDAASIRRYVSTQLPKGTLGEIEQIHSFKPRRGSREGNTGLKIKVSSGPHAGESYWVLYRPDRNYLKLYDKKEEETSSVSDAEEVETRREVSAVQDREPASGSESEVPQKVLDLSLFLKKAGETPQVDCQSSPQPEARVSTDSLGAALLKAVEPSLPSGPSYPLPSDEAAHFLRSTPSVQVDAFRIQSLARQLTQGMTDDASKVMAIHNWVTHNISYDTDSYFNKFLQSKSYDRKFDALEILELTPRTAVCGGYANLTIALLRASGIPARVVEGQVYWNGGAMSANCALPDPLKRHGWVEVWVNGQWVSMDPTADAGGVITEKRLFVSSPSLRSLDPTYFMNTHGCGKINDYY
jgi:transglutaminase-like putative cysteine protease